MLPFVSIRTAWAPAVLQPTSMLPLAPTARPADEHWAGPPGVEANLKSFPTVPSVLISATPPWSPANDGTEMKKEPVFGFQTGCSRPSAAAAPGIVMLVLEIVTGAFPAVVLQIVPFAFPAFVWNKVPKAGASALFGSSTCPIAGEYSSISTRLASAV